MVFDTLTNFKNYQALHPQFPHVLKFLNSTKLEQLALGRHEIKDSACFALVSEYTTKSINEGVIECHRKYIDIQIIVQGTEAIGICPLSTCAAAAYDPEKDFQKLEGEVSFIALRTGDFAIFFPQDGHMPGVNYQDKIEKVKKVVVKVPV
jgi:biofilm protein TabA